VKYRDVNTSHSKYLQQYPYHKYDAKKDKQNAHNRSERLTKRDEGKKLLNCPEQNTDNDASHYQCDKRANQTHDEALQ